MGLLIFDLDGTLVDSMDFHAAVFSQVLNSNYRIPDDLSRQVYFNTAGEPIDRQFHYALRRSGIRSSRLDTLIAKFWDVIQQSHPVLFVDVPHAIEQLWQASYDLAVSSSCPLSVVKSKLSKTGIDAYFSVLLGTDYASPGMTKGETHFQLLRQELELDPVQFRTNSALVGDGEYDMKIAKEAQILAIGRATSSSSDSLRKAGADFVIKSLDQLVSILHLSSLGSSTFAPISALRRHTSREHYRATR